MPSGAQANQDQNQVEFIFSKFDILKNFRLSKVKDTQASVDHFITLRCQINEYTRLFQKKVG